MKMALSKSSPRARSVPIGPHARFALSKKFWLARFLKCFCQEKHSIRALTYPMICQQQGGGLRLLPKKGLRPSELARERTNERERETRGRRKLIARMKEKSWTKFRFARDKLQITTMGSTQLITFYCYLQLMNILGN